MNVRIDETLKQPNYDGLIAGNNPKPEIASITAINKANALIAAGYTMPEAKNAKEAAASAAAPFNQNASRRCTQSTGRMA